MHNPVSTYRIQFHKNFSFEDFEKIIGYLKKLGVKTIYASPILEATPGSTHGYDGVNPEKINPEIGTEEQLRHINHLLKNSDMQWLQDIVPNHMAFHSSNAWLMDVLEKGRQSAYATFFDIYWEKGDRIMVPFLGGNQDEVIEKGELRLTFNDGRFLLSYYDNNYPVNKDSYLYILESISDKPQEFTQLIQRIKENSTFENWNDIIRELSSYYKRDDLKWFLENCVKHINETKNKLKELTSLQFYQLTHWQETDHRINFRRFFTINGLLSLNIQHKEVFDKYHHYIFYLLKEEIIQGLRIDHIDGLYDPQLYLDQLREVAGPDTYIIVEKILEPGEELPKKWDIQGNTGYDFLALSNNLFTYSASSEKFNEFYKTLSGDSVPISDQIHEKKSYILFNYMEGDLDNLVDLLPGLRLADEKVVSNLGRNTIKQAVAEFLIRCPVYRFYGNSLPLEEQEEKEVLEILNSVREHRKELMPAVNLLEDILLKKPRKFDTSFNDRAAHFYKRCMQFTGPLMAKGVEDTLMYTYARFIGHNEVGDSPESFGISVEEFHSKMMKRQNHWPLSLNATSTHDTKRGEDVSTRLNALTEFADEWTELVKKWQRINQSLKQNNYPDPVDEYFIYQTIVGTYPLAEQNSEGYLTRLEEYFTKAFREAKRHSNWTTPNEEYENAVKQFTQLILSSDEFLKTFKPFHAKISDNGIANSLSRTILKFTCPGIPDTYQGAELWDLSMVDPDNRRPVNYNERIQWLDNFQTGKGQTEKELIASLWQKRKDGNIKLWLTHTLLQLRAIHSTLFEKGHYTPLQVKGKYKDHVFAFARRYKHEWIVSIIPLHPGLLSTKQESGLQDIDWKNTRVILPPEAPDEWQNVLVNKKGKSKGEIYINEEFAEVPFSVLHLLEKENERGAGILAHITSLPSSFGVGDLGPEARSFADFLSRSKQKYWQLLPLNPTELGNGHSPYSSISSMAGNTLLISPELLMEEGLLTKQELEAHTLPSKSVAEFKKAEEAKKVLFEIAFTNFQKRESPLHHQYQLFCKEQSTWLDDFALYVVLKQVHQGKAWFQWSAEYKSRNVEALKEFKQANHQAIEKTKWLQFIFSRQWHGLKTYCNNLGIQLFGDLPFYVSYDSVDVWSNPEIFSIDSDGKMIGVAGVPPDYFNADGQLWGMPVFRWDVLKEKKYGWWIKRIRKNMELYDLLRLDHFRAFADYWEVPASETTAKNGKWKLGPGIDFFDAVKKELGELPFIAEDLGDISDAVIQLREELKLPGMKVLQFAFDESMGSSIFIPHNYTQEFVAYTGTHDNNTTVGWYRENTGKTEKENLRRYSGIKVKEKNVHEVLARMGYGSVAKICILPIQDVLGLDESARMNLPASVEKNWLWRLKPGQIKGSHEEQLREWVKIFNR